MLKKILVLGAMLLSCAVATMAQDSNRSENRGGTDRGGDRGGDRRAWDPAQMQQRMMEMQKERLEITDEAEWKAIQPLIEKVTAAQRQGLGERMRGFMGRPPGGEGRPPGDDRRTRGFGASSPEAEALQRAIDSKASKSELKTALEKYDTARKARQVELEKAQADLRKVLTPRQEAIATLSGLL